MQVSGADVVVQYLKREDVTGAPPGEASLCCT